MAATLQKKPVHDDRIRKDIAKFLTQAKKIGFKQVANRADLMLGYRNWHLETNFVHGEGRVILTQDRTAGDRSNTRKVTIYLHGRERVTHESAHEELMKVIK